MIQFFHCDPSDPKFLGVVINIAEDHISFYKRYFSDWRAFSLASYKFYYSEFHFWQ